MQPVSRSESALWSDSETTAARFQAARVLTSNAHRPSLARTTVVTHTGEVVLTHLLSANERKDMRG